MNISKSIFGENIPLLQLENFTQSYTLNVENTFLMGKENPPVSLQTASSLVIKQEKENDFLYNTIELTHITGDTENDTMKPFLLQSLALADISKSLCIKRNKDGKILSAKKKENLRKDWELWKQEKLSSVFPEEKDRNTFISNYEKGLEDFDAAIRKNLQYILLLPEIYSLIFPPNQHFVFLSGPFQFSSRLAGGTEYIYQLKLVKLDEEKDILSAELHSVLNNENDLFRNHLKKLYESNPGFSIDQFEFSIRIRYTFEKSTSRIIQAELYLTEKMHDHLAYTIGMKLESI